MSTAEPQDADLPKAVLKRMIKAKLQEVDKVRGGDGTRDFQVNKDALLAFGEAGKLFVHYLTATANDICKDAKRQTISADDVVTALNDLEFDEFVEPLKKCLEGGLLGMRFPCFRKACRARRGCWHETNAWSIPSSSWKLGWPTSCQLPLPALVANPPCVGSENTCSVTFELTCPCIPVQCSFQS